MSDMLFVSRDCSLASRAGRLDDRLDPLKVAFHPDVHEAEDENAATEVMRADPGVAAGVFAATLHRYAVAVARDGLDQTAREVSD